MKSLLLCLAVAGQSPQSLPAPQGPAPFAISAPVQQAEARPDSRAFLEIEPPKFRLPKFRIRREQFATVTIPAPPPQQLQPRAMVQWVYPVPTAAPAPQLQTLVPQAVPLPVPSKYPPSKSQPDPTGGQLDRIERLLDDLDARIGRIEASRPVRDEEDLPPLPTPKAPPRVESSPETQSQTSAPGMLRPAA